MSTCRDELQPKRGSLLVRGDETSAFGSHIQHVTFGHVL